MWLAAVKGAHVPGIKHIVCFVGEYRPDWIRKEYAHEPDFIWMECPDAVPGELSIGHYHNQGARLAPTEWIMKLDVDALPNVRFFKELLPLLAKAGPKEWFNCGMMMVSQNSTRQFLGASPLSQEVFMMITANRSRHCGPACAGPVATNFICRTKTYLNLGGCDDNFRGYGWEDYQQIYMLERHQQGQNPLPGIVNFDNVTRRCCREISRRKARELFQKNPWLCLLHHHHPASTNTKYKSHEIMKRNRQVLLDYILKYERPHQTG